ncbi:MAG: hypothetical protein R2797_04670 [Gelidibacter sp.]
MRKTVKNGAKVAHKATLQKKANELVKQVLSNEAQDGNFTPEEQAPQAQAERSEEAVAEPKKKSKKKAKEKAAKKRRYQPESGHGVNYDHFGQLIQFVFGIGTPPYSPPGTRLPLAQLEALYAQADLALQKVQTKKEVFQTAINERQAMFDTVSPLAAQVFGQLVACGADDKLLADFRNYANLLNGKRAKDIDPDSNDKHVSASHKSFANRIWSWNGIVTICAGFDDYESNDPALTVAALTDVKDALVNSNADFQKAFTDIKMARIHRDEVFYKAVTGLVPVALDVKAYIKALFGYKSELFKMVNHLSFKNFIKK